MKEDPSRGIHNLAVWCMRCGTKDHSTVQCTETGRAINMPDADDGVQCCLWCGIKGHDWEECFKRLPVAQREMNEKLSETTSQLDSTKDRLDALERRANRTDKALSNIHDIEADISTIKGQVERLLNWKSDTEKRLAKNDEEMSRFDKALKEHTKAMQKSDTQLMQHHATLTAFDRALIAAKIIPQLGMNKRPPVEDATDVDQLSQTSSSPRNKRDGASSSTAPASPDNRPRKRRPGSADNEWYMTLQPAVGADPNELWPEALMDELLVDWSPERFERLENWLKEWSSEEMLQTMMSLKTGVSRNTRNRGIRTILHGTKIPPKCFASRPATSA